MYVKIKCDFKFHSCADLVSQKNWNSLRLENFTFYVAFHGIVCVYLFKARQRCRHSVLFKFFSFQSVPNESKSDDVQFLRLPSDGDSVDDF